VTHHIDLGAIRLDEGNHAGEPDRGCVMNWVARFAGEPDTDEPVCTSRVLRAFAVSWNDALDDETRQRRLNVIELRHDARSLAAPFAVRRDASHCLRRRLGKRETRNAIHRRRRRFSAHEHAGDRLFGIANRRARDRGGNRIRIGHERRNEDRQGAIDVWIAQRDLQHVFVLRRCRSGEHVDRIADARFRGQDRPQRLPAAFAEARHFESIRLTRVGRENAGAAGIGHDRNAPALRHRLAREHHAHIEQLGHGVGANHT